MTRSYTQQDPIGIAGGLNLYGFANGDPVNFHDPFGLEADTIYVQYHEVRGSGKNHASLRIVPEDQERWTNAAGFAQGADGKWFTTISAGPRDGLLIGEPLRDSDAVPHGTKEAVDLGGRDENNVISALTQSMRGYNSNPVPYAFDPRPFGRYHNSNSFVSGILASVGLSFTTGVSSRTLPGWQWPVPSSRFVIP